MRPIILSSVVDNDLCIGCGLCAAMCPDNALKMQFNKYGEYNPAVINECKTECGLCLKVCPFANSDENEDTIGKRLYGEIPGIQSRAETGYYLDTYVGYSERHRLQSASGGMATWILEALFEEGIIDHAICVAPTSNPEKLFSFHVFDTPEDVRSGVGSAYYPVEMSDVIRHVMDHPGRYAITGLPCFIKAIRFAQQRNKKLKERIVVTVGLVCGQLKSKHFTDYIGALAGVRGKVIGVRFRGKCLVQPASNYHYSFESKDGEKVRIFWKDGIDVAWTNRWFTPNACNYCDDVFAECADVVCMDAWLPEYSGDRWGTSLVLARSLLIKKLIGKINGPSIELINVEKVIQSQQGVLTVKRRHLAYRLHLNKTRDQNILKKRVPTEEPNNPFLRQEVILKERMQSRSRESWLVYSPDIKCFRQTLEPDLIRLQQNKFLSGAIDIPIGLLRKVISRLKL